MAVAYTILAILAVVFIMVMLNDLPSTKPRSERKALMHFAVMEKTNNVRTWLTPFDITDYNDAVKEALMYMKREPECEYCVIYFQKEGEVAREFFKVSRP